MRRLSFMNTDSETNGRALIDPGLSGIPKFLHNRLELIQEESLAQTPEKKTNHLFPHLWTR